MGHAKEITAESFDKFVGKGVSVIDFWAAWCGPCQMMGPIFEEVAKEMEGKAAFGKVDVDKTGELAQRFMVMSIPTLIVFKNGEQVDRISGVAPKDALKKRITDHL
jgi:thioredoxin 1